MTLGRGHFGPPVMGALAARPDSPKSTQSLYNGVTQQFAVCIER